MTDYQMEQEMEIEALEAILMDDFKKVDGDGPEGLGTSEPCYSVILTPKVNDDDDTDYPVKMSLVFSYTPTYPDEAPLMKVRSIRGATKEDISDLQAKLETEAEESIGLAMIYTLSQSANEWLQERYAAVKEDPGEVDEDGLTREEKEAIKKAEERRKYGTPVTRENFLEWFEAFRARKALERAKIAKNVTATTATGKKTGRQFFEQRGDDEITALEKEADEFDDSLLDDLDEDLLDDLIEDEEEGGSAQE